MAVVLLAVTIVLSVMGGSCLKASHGMQRKLAGITGIGIYLLDYFLLSKVILYINVSIAYALLCGVGIIGASIMSAVGFHQRLSKRGILFAAMIVFGVVYIRLFGGL